MQVSADPLGQLVQRHRHPASNRESVPRRRPQKSEQQWCATNYLGNWSITQFASTDFESILRQLRPMRSDRLDELCSCPMCNRRVERENVIVTPVFKVSNIVADWASCDQDTAVRVSLCKSG